MKRKTIGWVAKEAGVNAQTILYYERRGLLKACARLSSGYRLFDDETVRRIRFIRHAKELGFTLEEIKQLLGLRAGGSECAQVRKVAEAKATDIQERIEKLSSMRVVLLDLARRCEQDGSIDACPILKTLEAADG